MAQNWCVMGLVVDLQTSPVSLCPLGFWHHSKLFIIAACGASHVATLML